MQQHDDVVSAWLSGANSAEGLESPAGPLYLDNADTAVMNFSNVGRGDTGVTTVSCRPKGCACC